MCHPQDPRARDTRPPNREVGPRFEAERSRSLAPISRTQAKHPQHPLLQGASNSELPWGTLACVASDPLRLRFFCEPGPSVSCKRCASALVMAGLLFAFGLGVLMHGELGSLPLRAFCVLSCSATAGLTKLAFKASICSWLGSLHHLHAWIPRAPICKDRMHVPTPIPHPRRHYHASTPTHRQVASTRLCMERPGPLGSCVPPLGSQSDAEVRPLQSLPKPSGPYSHYPSHARPYAPVAKLTGKCQCSNIHKGSR